MKHTSDKTFEIREIFFFSYDSKVRYNASYKEGRPFLVDCDGSGKRLLENIKSCSKNDINEQKDK